jgi:coproporphyrinogen III oxidase
MDFEQKKIVAKNWFEELRDKICAEFEKIEAECGSNAKFLKKPWDRNGGGGGVISLLNGEIFEKVGVNVSTVHGQFDPKFAKEIPGADQDPSFWASGISLVAHMKSPLVPAVHMNTRMIVTSKQWFGGGADLTPTFEFAEDTQDFHEAFKAACDKSDPTYHPKFKEECDKYFYLPHRNEARGIGGIFYDYLNSGNWDNDFKFTKDVGLAFLDIFPKLVRRHYKKEWNNEQKEAQLIKRGRYAEFNLIYDRGTKFGLMTGGNTEAILMSLPPEVKWTTAA